MSSLYRFDFFVDSEHPNSLEGENAFHTRVDKYGNDIMRTYNFSAADSVDSALDKEKNTNIKKKLKKFVNDAKSGILRSHTTYANAYFKNLEMNLRRLDWITRAKKCNIILVRLVGFERELHPTDAQVVNRYIDQMNIKDRSVKTEYMSTDKNATVIDLLDCGHWGHVTNKWLAREIRNKL